MMSTISERVGSSHSDQSLAWLGNMMDFTIFGKMYFSKV